MAKRQSKADAAIERRIEEAYRRSCSGIHIDMMDIDKVFRAGRTAIEGGADEAALQVALRDFAEAIRRN
jgi:hypothetical protein